MIIEILLASVLIMLASLSGVVVIWKGIGRYIEKNLDYLVSFAAGVFLILVFNLSQEVIHDSPTVSLGLFWIVLGLISIWLITKIIPEGHHHHRDDESTHPHTKLDARKLLIGDMIHNIGDGILVTTAFLAGSIFGVITAMSIVIHEMVQEISEFFCVTSGWVLFKRSS